MDYFNIYPCCVQLCDYDLKTFPVLVQTVLNTKAHKNQPHLKTVIRELQKTDISRFSGTF